MQFNYYYGSQADQFSFIRIPKKMLTEKIFSTLSIPSKVLYGVLLDRMTLSRKNGWFDEENRVFIIYQIGEIQQDLGFSKKKAMGLLSELESFGLLEKKRRGHGLPNILYVKSFMTELEDRRINEDISMKTKTGSRCEGFGTSGSRIGVSGSADPETSRSGGLGTYRVQDSSLQEVSLSAPLKNKTNINQTDWNDIESDQILSVGSDKTRFDTIADASNLRNERVVSEAEAYELMIWENIAFEDLVIAHPYDRELIEGIAALILETVLSVGDTILIASNRYPADVVKNKFLKLTYSHIEYVLFCLRRNTTKVNNIKKYLLAALFNAPSTISGYYQAEVKHDMPELVGSNQ